MCGGPTTTKTNTINKLKDQRNEENKALLVNGLTNSTSMLSK
jgi:hypothetical protein